MKGVAPNISEITNILLDELKQVRSIEEIEILFNRYNLSFEEFPYSPFIPRLMKYLLKNNEVDIGIIKEWHKTQLHLKNKSDIFNILYDALYKNNSSDINGLIEEYIPDSKNVDKIIHLFYSFITNKTPTGNVDTIKRKIQRHFKDLHKNNYSSKLMDSDKELLDTLIGRLSIQSISFKNIHSNKTLLNDVSVLSHKNANLMHIHKLSNLLVIKNIINTQESRYSTELSIKISETELEIKTLTASYNQERKTQIDFLTNCRGVRIDKIYNSLRTLNNDNGEGDIYKDFDYDSLYIDLSLLFKIIYNEPPYATLLEGGAYGFVTIDDGNYDKIKNIFYENYIYLDDKTIEDKIREVIHIYQHIKTNNTDPNLPEVINLLENFDIKNKLPFSQLTIGTTPLKNRASSNSMALLVQDGQKYLFKRTGTTWHVVSQDEYYVTPKSFNFKNANILKFNIKELGNIFTTYEDTSAIDPEADCIRIGSYLLPKRLYKFIMKLDEKKKFIEQCKLILKYKETIDSDIETLTSLIEHTFKNEKRERRQTMLNATSATIPKIKQFHQNIPKSIVNEYTNIFKISEPEEQMKSLIEYSERNGIDYNISSTDLDDPERASKTSKFYYYNSSIFCMKLCCKHEMEFKRFVGQSDRIKETILGEIKNKYGTQIDGNYICRDCGRKIDDLELSAWEGYSRTNNNKVISFREETPDEEDLDELEVAVDRNLDFYNKYQHYPEIHALKYILSEMNINLLDEDWNHIRGLYETDTEVIYSQYLTKEILSECMYKTYLFILYSFKLSIKSKKPKKSKKSKKSKKTNTQEGGAHMEITELTYVKNNPNIDIIHAFFKLFSDQQLPIVAILEDRGPMQEILTL